MIKKEKAHGFGRDMFMLGKDENGIKLWLQAPSWDCEWYWGFGYIQSMKSNRKPSVATDIDMHCHVDSSLLGKDNAKDGSYCSNIYDAKMLHETAFDEREGWTLSELFESYYLLKKSAAFFGRGGSHITKNPLEESLKDEKLAARINQELIPKVTAAIIAMLTPKV